MNKVTLQPAFVLHTRPYRDTSLLVELFTEHHGRLTMVARGVRGTKSKLKGMLSLFLPVLITYSGKTDLKTLQNIEPNGLSYSLKGKTLLSSFYLNELLMKLLPSHEAYPGVYQSYQKTLKNLVDSKDLEIELRIFEKNLLSELGYGLELAKDVDGLEIESNQQYSFEFEKGFSRSDIDHAANFSGKNLLALHRESFSNEEEIREAKRLLRLVIANLLGNKKLKSRELFKKNNDSIPGSF